VFVHITHVSQNLDSVMHRMNTTTQQQLFRSDRVVWRTLQTALVYPVLYPIKVHRCIRSPVGVDKTSFREQLCYWCLTTLKSNAWTSAGACILTFVTATCCSTISRALATANSFLLLNYSSGTSTRQRVIFRH